MKCKMGRVEENRMEGFFQSSRGKQLGRGKKEKRRDRGDGAEWTHRSSASPAVGIGTETRHIHHTVFRRPAKSCVTSRAYRKDGGAVVFHWLTLHILVLAKLTCSLGDDLCSSDH